MRKVWFERPPEEVLPLKAFLDELPEPVALGAFVSVVEALRSVPPGVLRHVLTGGAAAG
ncbi:hypothetical protein JOF29_002156 [Kribbella aluminosa]|uniref:Uncharacterized protein n=1 Tax=Kribbella aluminosa TaxID=416017 RepID=A0ABS4UHH7_9ACTN|nr:hypothetical protein [Kribbella aluminosa]